MLDVMDRLKGQCELVLDSMTDDELETKHRTFLRETMMVKCMYSTCTPLLFSLMKTVF